MPGVATGMEDQGDQDYSPSCYHFSPGRASCMASQAQCPAPEKTRNSIPTCMIGVSPPFPGSLRLWEPRGPLAAPHPGSGHPCCLCQQSGCQQAGSCPPGGARCPWPAVCIPHLGGDREAGTAGLGLRGNALLGCQLSLHPFHQRAPEVSAFTE